jgi:large subunit ribosomal protein L18
VRRLSGSREKSRKARHLRVRKKVSGTPERPRLNVFKSHKHIYAQVIDDNSGKTLVSAVSAGGNIAAAGIVGSLVAKRAAGKGIKKVVFDRGGYLYHGRIKALADAVRKESLEL